MPDDETNNTASLDSVDRGIEWQKRRSESSHSHTYSISPIHYVVGQCDDWPRRGILLCDDEVFRAARKCNFRFSLPPSQHSSYPLHTYLLFLYISSLELHIPLFFSPSLFPSLSIPLLHLPLSLLNPPQRHRLLPLQHLFIPLMRLRLAILETGALVIFQHAVVAAKVALAEGAVADDALRGGFAVFEGAFDLLGRHAAADGEGDVEGGVLGDGEGGEGGWLL